MNSITDAASYLIKAILPPEAKVEVNTREENGTIIIEITAMSEYIGQLIGKEGKIIKSIRTLLNLSFPDQKYLLEIKE
ncbi:MAG: KH domain-containing protein [Patescibacteria group bacterium]